MKHRHIRTSRTLIVAMLRARFATVRSLARGRLMIALVVAFAFSGCSTAAQQRAERVSNQDATVHLELAQAYFQRGEFEVALSEVNTALRIQPDDASAYGTRALIDSALNDQPAAQRDYQQALNLDPRNPTIRQDYGWFLCTHRRYGASFSEFQQALSDATYVQASKTYLALGVCRYRANEFGPAIEALQHGLRLVPGNPAMQTNLAVALLGVGKIDRAWREISLVNNGPYANSQSLWIGVLIAHRLHRNIDQNQWMSQLINKYPNSRWSALALENRYGDRTIFQY